MEQETKQTTSIKYDWYGDPWAQKNGVVLGGMFYYFLDEKRVQAMTSKNVIAIPPTESVVSVCLYPYLSENDIQTTEVVFDVKKYQLNDYVELDKDKVYRISEFQANDKKVGTFKRYNIPSTATPGGRFSWQKEGKLWQYPYTKLELNDHLGTPFEIQPHLYLSNTNTQAVHVRTALNNMGLYLMYSPNYKGDSDGLINGVITSGLNMPTTSSYYMDFMARSQESLKASRTSSAISAVSSTGVGAIAGAKMGASLGPQGALVGGIIGGLGGLVTGASGLSQSFAQERDAKNSPATLREAGGDALFNLQITNNQLLAYRYQYPLEVMERLGWYFHLYGYAQNKVMRPNLRSRYYYNHIKCSDVNLDSSGVPKHHLNKLKAIYKNGTTIWHMDRKGVVIGDYSKDNYEV